MNAMRQRFKELANDHSSTLQAHLGELVDDVWEVVRTGSKVIERCLNTDMATNSEKYLYLLLVLRNSLSDCCCCLDAVERGHDRTVYNNIRMILEDLSAAIHANGDEKILNEFCNGNHQASNSITFAKKHYSNLGRIYGKLSEISHHSKKELAVRQWVNREGQLSHLKPFNSNHVYGHLNILSLIIQLARIIGEVSEDVCIKELPSPYFWSAPKIKKKIPLSILSLQNSVKKLQSF